MPTREAARPRGAPSLHPREALTSRGKQAVRLQKMPVMHPMPLAMPPSKWQTARSEKVACVEVRHFVCGRHFRQDVRPVCGRKSCLERTGVGVGNVAESGEGSDAGTA